jgi:hypothetical protein
MAHGQPFSAKLPGHGGALCRPREAIAMARKSKHEDDLSSRVVEFAMASWDMQCTQSYVERRRRQARRDPHRSAQSLVKVKESLCEALF